MRLHPHDAFLCEILGRSRDSKRVLEHVEQCPKCQVKLALRASADRFRRADYTASFERSYQIFEQRQASLARERGEAPQLLARLIGLIPERQQLLLRNSRRFQTWGLLELLVQYGEQETFVDPVHAKKIFELALAVSINLDSSWYGKQQIEDVRAQAWGGIGNARRVMMELTSSEEAFEEAFSRLRKGTGDLRERVILVAQQASLRRAQQRYDESLRLSGYVISVFEKAGEKHQAGKELVTLSLVHSEMGNIKTSLSVLGRSLDLIDPVQEPRVALSALHNLTNDLVIAGSLMKARRVFLQARPLYKRHGDPRARNMGIWLEGRIACGLGHHRDAEALMIKARDGFLSVNASYESDQVARELASLQAR